MSFDFVKIADLEKHEKGANIGKFGYHCVGFCFFCTETLSFPDVIGIVNSDLGISEIVSKVTGKPVSKYCI
jgi:hypothetical protein